MLPTELGGKIYAKKRENTKTYDGTSRYVLLMKFCHNPSEGSTIIKGVSFTQVGLRLSSEETDRDGYIISKRKYD